MAWLLLVSMVIFATLVDYVLQGSRDELMSPGLYDFGDQVLPAPMNVLRQQRRHSQSTFRRLYHLR